MSAMPSASRRALAWSSARRSIMPSRPSRSATRPAAARMPAWRMPPPSSFRARWARPMNALRADDDRADRAAEALRQAERDRVGRRGEVPRADAERDRGVEEPRPVDVERDAVVVGDRRDLRACRRGSAAGSSSGCGRSRWRRGRSAARGVVRVAEGVARSRPRSSVPSGRSRSCRDRRPDDDRVVGGLVVDDVGLAAGDDLLAAGEVGHQRDEVAHRAGA